MHSPSAHIAALVVFIASLSWHRVSACGTVAQDKGSSYWKVKRRAPGEDPRRRERYGIDIRVNQRWNGLG
jgi:hypothetical protein